MLWNLLARMWFYRTLDLARWSDLDCETQVRERCPGIVYASISGVGRVGPYVHKRIYDPMIQSLAGLADIQADTHTGRPRMTRTIIVDKATAIYAAQAITAALFHQSEAAVQRDYLDAGRWSRCCGRRAWRRLR